MKVGSVTRNDMPTLCSAKCVLCLLQQFLLWLSKVLLRPPVCPPPRLAFRECCSAISSGNGLDRTMQVLYYCTVALLLLRRIRYSPPARIGVSRPRRYLARVFIHYP